MQNLPLIVLGFTGFTAGFVALLLPETLYSPMPQTVNQVEEWPEDYGLPCTKHKTRFNEVSIQEKSDRSSKDQGDVTVVETTV